MNTRLLSSSDWREIDHEAALSAQLAVAPKPVAPAATQPAGLARILRPQSGGYQWLMPQVATITPQYLQMVLMAAAQGSHIQQAALFRLMLDTWPELAACVQELTFGALRKKLIIEPYREDDEQPTDTALEKAKVAGAALKAFRPDPAADENDFQGTLRDILQGWVCGVSILEIGWQVTQTPALGQFRSPRATWWAEPSTYALSNEGLIGLNYNALIAAPGTATMQGLSPNVLPFPEHKFLIGINKSQSGTPFGSAILRALAWWWCAANFSADWLLGFAQIFGVPLRWATYDPNAPQATVDAICNMLQNMGAMGWGAFPTGTNLDIKESSKGSDHSPQGELLDRADRYARLLILGQTMSGSQDASKGGGKAFGSVETNVKQDRIEAAGKFACSVVNLQLIRSIILLTYGEDSELPEIRLLEEEEGDLTEAQRDIALAAAGLKIGVNFLRKKYNIPEPGDDEETLADAKPETPTGDGAQAAQVSETETPPAENDDPAKAKSAMAVLAKIHGLQDDAEFQAALKAFGDALVAGDASLLTKKKSNRTTDHDTGRTQRST